MQKLVYQDILVVGYGCGAYPEDYIAKVLNTYYLLEGERDEDVQIRIWFLGGQTNRKSHPGKTEAETMMRQFKAYAQQHLSQEEIEGLRLRVAGISAITALQDLESYMQCRNAEQKQDIQAYQMFNNRNLAAEPSLDGYVPREYLTPVIICDYTKKLGIECLWNTVAGTNKVKIATSNGMGKEYESNAQIYQASARDFTLQCKIVNNRIVRWLHEKYRAWKVKQL